MKKQQKREKEPKNSEILIAVNRYADIIEKDIRGVQNDIGTLKEKVTNIEGDVQNIKETMVTRNYFDKRFQEMDERLETKVKKGDKKITVLVDILHDQKIISSEDRTAVIRPLS